MRTIKKAQSGVKQKPVRKISVDNTSTGPKRNIVKDIKAERTTVANKNKAITNSYISKSKEYKKDSDRDKDTSARLKLQNMMGEYSAGMSPDRALEVSKFGEKQAKTKDSLSTVYSKKAKESVKNPKYKPALKNGGSVKAKDGKWMQKASASIKRRGTKGVCTGAKFGGPTCKPGSKRYNLAKTFKSIAKKKK
jgi:hypothetical protein